MAYAKGLARAALASVLLPRSIEAVIAWELWDTSTIAERFKLTRKYVEERVVAQPTFPMPVPVTDGGRPRWIASEVIAWVEARRQAA